MMNCFWTGIISFPIVIPYSLHPNCPLPRYPSRFTKFSFATTLARTKFIRSMRIAIIRVLANLANAFNVFFHTLTLSDTMTCVKPTSD
jgi:hypothetical protein